MSFIGMALNFEYTRGFAHGLLFGLAIMGGLWLFLS